MDKSPIPSENGISKLPIRIDEPFVVIQWMGVSQCIENGADG
jgi:hypothetical protein